MNNTTKITRGISLDKDLVQVADELLPNRSEAAQNGLLEATMSKIDTLNAPLQEAYKKRLAHLTK